MNESLIERARAVLRDNSRGRHTIPSARLYPHQWAWDSAFAAIGWSTFDVDRATDELEALFEAQWPDGRIPHIKFDADATDYFPGPSFWHAEGTSTITNPPVWACAARIIMVRGGDRDRLAALVPKIAESLEFFTKQRDPLGWGGVAVVHPWESGRDNCPAWDSPLAAINPADAPAFERVDIAKVESPDQRPTDEEYRRYAVLVKAIAADGFGPGPFAVYDPFMTAIFARAADDLSSLAQAIGMESPAVCANAAAARACLDRLWSEEHGRWTYYDAAADERLTPDVLAAHLPLTCNTSADVAKRSAANLDRDYSSPTRLPTTPPSSLLHDPKRYWRGPCWVSMNWLFATGSSALFDELATHTIDLVERSGFWEYFHPQTGQGLGTGGFTWSAALALDLSERLKER